MDLSTLEGYLTKQQVAQTHGCSDRTVQRDISKLLKLRDDEALSHLRLATDDGTVRLATEVTVEVIEQLNHDGLKPRWYIDAIWAEAQYGQHAETTPPDRPDSGGSQPTDQPASDVRSEPPENGEIATLLREQIRQLEKHNQQLSEQLANRSEREKETNVLIRDLHNLMADMQHRLLPARSEASHNPDATITVPATQSPSGAAIDSDPKQDSKLPTTSMPLKTQKGSRRQTTTTAAKKSKASRRKPAKSKTGRKPAPAKKTKVKNVKEETVPFFSTSMPTVRKLFRSRRQ